MGEAGSFFSCLCTSSRSPSLAASSRWFQPPLVSASLVQVPTGQPPGDHSSAGALAPFFAHPCEWQQPPAVVTCYHLSNWFPC